MKILIRFDDIAENMNWHLMSRCEKLFDELDIKPVMGVIPDNKDKDLLIYPKKKISGMLLRIGSPKVGR